MRSSPTSSILFLFELISNLANHMVSYNDHRRQLPSLALPHWPPSQDKQTPRFSLAETKADALAEAAPTSGRRCPASEFATDQAMTLLIWLAHTHEHAWRLGLSRRRGKESSASRVALMDAVEAVMLQEGYAALSARSIAKRVDLNYQLIFYYFETLDGLLLATYQRRTKRMLEMLKHALDQERPLHALWQTASNPDGAALSLEYMAMSNHKPAIRAETVQFSEETFRLVSTVMQDRFGPRTTDEQSLDVGAVSMIVAMLGTNLGLQTAQGISGPSVDGARKLIERWIETLEPT